MRWHPMRGGGGAGQLNVLFCNSWPGGASCDKEERLSAAAAIFEG